ncbi:hypothetical protein [Alteromonas confluentis]|uniref:Uncharacterized protein n=1 Tax=Alteromonas confluentis TaxID=1656094 RepID=A0A1E7ZDU6_9ALTE|nr:hypothetical protein [Alteromonas confluentis]OFC71679.1 hypothetical protein BFC18_05845 [Alteromonas confluentis]
MVKILLVTLFLTFSITCIADCKRWEYGSLLTTVTSNGKKPEDEKFDSVTVWRSPAGLTVWSNNKLLSSDSTDKSLKDYFSVKSLDPINILNSLGNLGWESYGFEIPKFSGNEKSQNWQLKRCKLGAL